MNEYLTINDLIRILNEIPIEDRNLPLYSDFEGSFINDIMFNVNEDGTCYGMDVYYSMICPESNYDSND